jgi:hypothetical protein
MVADAIAEKLGCQVEELVDTTRRTGFIGAIRSGLDAALRRMTVLAPIKHTPASFDLIVIGTPIWDRSLPPAIRTYLATFRGQLPRVAFFCTARQTGAGRVFEEMTKVGGRAPLAVLAVHALEVARPAYLRDVQEFVDEIRQTRAAA